MQQKYYRADYGHFKSPALTGWEAYVQKITKTSQNELSQQFEKQ